MGRRLAPPTAPAPPRVDVERLRRDLRAAVRGGVRFDPGSRAMYATDASNYRQPPIGVVVPADPDDAVAAVEVCRAHDAPVLSRGGGTSLAGECCNVAVVLDWSRHANRVESIDPQRRLAVVQPGVVLDELNQLTGRRHGLSFGPKPSTHSHCTLGGMIGNNSCGSTAQRFGTTAQNVTRLEVLTYDGTRMWVGGTSDEEFQRIIERGGRPAEIHRALRDLRDRCGEQVRERFPDIPRRISGFNLDQLLPERGFHVARALVGSEGTCVTVLRAEVTLLPELPARALVLLGFRDIFAAAAAVPAVNRCRPVAVEGMDDLLIDFERRTRLNPEAVRQLPDAGAWLMVQLAGEDRDEVAARAEALRREVGDPAGSAETVSVETVTDPARQAQLWGVRESALGATSRVPGMPDNWPGWEDSAVAPERLADYLRDLRRLQREHGLDGASVYGHFGHGCVHCRMPFELSSRDGVRRYREFVERAADLVVAHGGSLSGEHGDGQARGELLQRMYGEDLVREFGEFKRIFDPQGRMNPGKVVDPSPLDADLRLGPDYAPARPVTWFRYPDDDGRLSRAADRCVGVGECRRADGGVMCPSYMVTREERHSTRGRARLLHEMLRGEVITDGWRSREVRDALDLCLACKGCRTDCPVNVDMATYKAEFLAHHYAGRARPMPHYSLGWLPVWARLASVAPWLANSAARAPGAARSAGIDPWRRVPRLAASRFTDWLRRRGPRGGGHRGSVVLWPDTFTDCFDPEIAVSAVVALEAAGFHVELPDRDVCCGLTWISTGQLGMARRSLLRTLRSLESPLRRGLPVVGLEPSCTAVLRADAVELLGRTELTERLRRQTRTLAELLAEVLAEHEFPAPLDGQRAIAQTHCHQHAVMGFDADRELMGRIGLDVEVLDSGCCGLAGDFGMTASHRDVSLACAERVLLPAVREADRDTLVLADGFSCRAQISDAGTGRRAVHLAQAAAAAVRGDPLGELPERDVIGGDRWRERTRTAAASGLTRAGSVMARSRR